MTANTRTTVTTRRPWYRPSLTTQIVLGGLLGYIRLKNIELSSTDYADLHRFVGFLIP
jgi:hypothetical protein